MSVKKYLLMLLMFCAAVSGSAQNKRDFRGAWIQCVNGQFEGLASQDMQRTLSYQLDELQKDGVNAIFFQVRAECDALYPSKYEPWSRFLSGKQGQAPSPYWDPLQWMITQCHQRGMELHAWVNPYRAKTKNTNELAASHIAIQHPDRVFPYDGLYILNPGIPENREYICKVVDDIVRRYDVDGIHMDDYFYPYPATGQVIPDDAQYKQYNNGITDRGDWRRYNVNLFIQQMHDSIQSIKPWVKFGVSPFGIYRNQSKDPNGSNTRGLSNYDDLYADVLLWVNNGWVDYNVPQLYWQIGHPTADYETLIRWWSQHASKRHLYIGEDVERTVKYPDVKNANTHQQAAKYALHATLPNIDGTVLWYAKMAVDNPGNYATMLRQYYWKNPALQPSMPWLSKVAPKKVRRLKPMMMDQDYVLFWTEPNSGKNWATEATKYVVYRFAPDEKINIEDASHIVAITNDTFLKLPYVDGHTKYTYVVTALNRIQNESKITKKKIKL